MALAYSMSEGFELGTFGNFSSLTDSSSEAGYLHYKPLAQKYNILPFKGNFVGHIDMSIGQADSYWQITSALDSTAGQYAVVRFYVLCKNLAGLTSTNHLTIFRLQSAGPVTEAGFGIRNNSGTYEFWGGETSPAGTVRSQSLVQNVWHCIEIVALIDSGGPNDGTLQFFVDGQQMGATITGLDQGAITQAWLGAVSIDASVTAGDLFFDEFSCLGGQSAGTRIGPIAQQYPDYTDIVTHNQHVITGRGTARVWGTGTSTDGVFDLYDTDNASLAQNLYQPIRTIRNIDKTLQPGSDGGTVSFNNGLYVNLGGTLPVAFVEILDAERNNEAQKLNLVFGR